jgi:L-Ala-D/L-Glu epimerase
MANQTASQSAAMSDLPGDESKPLAADGPPVEEVSVWRVQLPLTRPYHLSFGPLETFDLILVRVTSDGSEGWGESAPLPGYSDEDTEQVWGKTVAVAEETVGRTPRAALTNVANHGLTGFEAVALTSALEDLAGVHGPRNAIDVPLLGTVLTIWKEGGTGEERDRLSQEIEELVSAGYKTLKLKVGWDVNDDISYIAAAQEVTAGRAELRIDANQGYAIEEAVQFANAVDPGDIELLEQPLPADAWEDIRAFRSNCPLPVMLDESIKSIRTVEWVLEHECADFVKFKLMKAGSITGLEELVRFAIGGGLRVVVGNGVASPIDNYHELMSIAGHGLPAGEMNGFLKPSVTFLRNPYTVAGGVVSLPAGYRPDIDLDLLEQFSNQTSRHRAARGA